MHRKTVVRVADHAKHRAADRPALVLQRGDLAVVLTVLAALKRKGAFFVQPLDGGRARQDRVVPGEPCDWFGELLQPAVVAESTVEDRGIEAKRQFLAG